MEGYVLDLVALSALAVGGYGYYLLPRGNDHLYSYSQEYKNLKCCSRRYFKWAIALGSIALLIKARHLF